MNSYWSWRMPERIRGMERDADTEIRRSLSGLYNVLKIFRILQPNSMWWMPEENIILSMTFSVRKTFSQQIIISGELLMKMDFSLVRSGYLMKVLIINSVRCVCLAGRHYGVLSLELGVLEGTPNSSKLVPEVYQRMSGKTEKFGGLYIYRDDFRVLPMAGWITIS